MESSVQLPVTIATARKILGDDAASFTDEEITALIRDLELLAQAYIQAVQNNDKLRVNIEYYRYKEKRCGSNEVRSIRKSIDRGTGLRH